MHGCEMSQPIYCDPTAFAEPHLFISTDNATFSQLVQYDREFALGCANLTGPLFELTGTNQVIQDLELL